MPIPFDIPEHFAPLIAMGKIVRYGGILKDVDTGRIVGHLQETGALYDALSALPKAALNPFSAIPAMVQAAATVTANVQIHRLDAKVEQTLQLVEGLQALQVANLAVARLGLGVSVATFGYLKYRMDKAELRLDGIQAGVMQVLDEQRPVELERLETDLDAQLSHAEEAWHHGDGGQRAWARVADRLNDMVYKYPKHIERELATSPVADDRMLMYLLERFRVLAATRVECLILTGELQTALDFSRRFAQQTESLLGRVTPLQFVDRGQAASNQFPQLLIKGQLIAARLHEFQDMTVTKPLLIGSFIDHKVDGRD